MCQSSVRNRHKMSVNSPLPTIIKCRVVSLFPKDYALTRFVIISPYVIISKTDFSLLWVIRHLGVATIPYMTTPLTRNQECSGKTETKIKYTSCKKKTFSINNLGTCELLQKEYNFRLFSKCFLKIFLLLFLLAWTVYAGEVWNLSAYELHWLKSQGKMLIVFLINQFRYFCFLIVRHFFIHLQQKRFFNKLLSIFVFYPL